MNINTPPFSDDDLLQFADGQANADLTAQIVLAMRTDLDLAARVDAMQLQTQDIKDALDLATLQVPQIPAHLTADVPPMRRVSLPLAIACSFALGMLAMRLLQPTPTWIDSVASYQALYVQDTLRGDVQDPSLTQAVLSQVALSVGVDLSAIPELSGMMFKRAQMLAIDNTPLVQIAYLATDGTPFALCIVRVDDADHLVESEQSHGLAAASWVRNGVGFVLIGGADVSRVSGLAKDLSGRI